jgi:hypothetical protein
MVRRAMNLHVNELLALREGDGENERNPPYLEAAVDARLPELSVRNLRVISVDHAVQRILNRLDHVIVVERDFVFVVVVSRDDLQTTRERSAPIVPLSTSSGPDAAFPGCVVTPVPGLGRERRTFYDDLEKEGQAGYLGISL